MSRKSLLALLLVMIMACCAVFTAGAESILPIGDSAFSVSAGVEINQDGFAQLMAKSGQSIPVQPELLNAVISIINNTTIKATVAGKAAQAEVLMKDTPVVTIAGQLGDNGVTVVTDLLPSYAVVVSNEEIQQLVEQLKSSLASSGINFDLNEDDLQYLLNTVLTQATPAIMKITTSFGPEEAGEWAYEGVTFTSRQPLNMTTKELVVTVLEAVNNIVSDAKVQSILGNFGIKPEQLNLTSTLENAKNANEADMPALTFYKYSVASGDMYFTLELMKDGQGFTAEGGMVGGVVVCHINSVPDLFKVDATIKESGEVSLYFFANGAASGNNNSPFSTMEIFVNGIPGGNAYDLSIRLAMDQTDFATMKLAFAPGGEVNASFDTTGKKVLGLQDIIAIAQGSDTETLNALKGEITTAAMTLLGKLAGIFPTEITQLMTVVQQLNR